MPQIIHLIRCQVERGPFDDETCQCTHRWMPTKRPIFLLHPFQ
ncbi:hypothetical protein EZ449_12205 [Pedobacter frigidisoli]|uniref:Uncharacterized protein n=1 Tax=Pedobacter frigidisoli TaxID=2530455 RepID=A0A4R0P3G6_9SPHI|nr:hypothetical protein EZ449_12205 [Pedobacter frigidisoli]